MSWSEVKKVNSNLNTPLNEGGVKIVKSVQRGVVKNISAPSVLTININAINVNKSIIIVETAMFKEATGAVDSVANGMILSSTQIQVSTSPLGGSGIHCSAFWQVVEFY